MTVGNHEFVATDTTRIATWTTGSGPALLLLHGWPHTHRLWDLVLPGLAETRRVILPDLRGTGDSDRPSGGYDAATIAADLDAVLDGLHVDRVTVVGTDVGATLATFYALTRAERVAGLGVCEGALGTLPGGEAFHASPPWWFGFHRTPGLAETVLEGHEAEYLGFFLREHTFERRGVPAGIETAFVAAHTGRDRLRGGFEHYRADAAKAGQLAAAARRLPVPVLSVEGGVARDVATRQLAPLADDLRVRRVPDCGHLVALERPDAFVDAVLAELP